MTPRRGLIPLAAVLGALAAFLVACGDRNGLIPRRDAAALTGALDRVRDAVRASDCPRAVAALRDAQDAYQGLPPDVDARLRERIAEGLGNLAAIVPGECGEPTVVTEPPTTETTPTETIPPETTPTQTTPPETTPTQTTPPETTPTQTTPPDGGAGSGGTPPPGGAIVGGAGQEPGR